MAATGWESTGITYRHHRDPGEANFGYTPSEHHIEVREASDGWDYRLDRLGLTYGPHPSRVAAITAALRALRPKNPTTNLDHPNLRGWRIVWERL